jgi:hypothetical protein
MCNTIATLRTMTACSLQKSSISLQKIFHMEICLAGTPSEWLCESVFKLCGFWLLGTRHFAFDPAF